jgi:hypothetical protein
VTVWAAVLAVLSATVMAAVASWLVCRSLSVAQRARHHEVGSPIFLQVGVMLSVLLAFVFSETWAQYNDAAEAINGECGALHGAAILASALPDHRGQPIERAIASYVHTVSSQEWPMMAARQISRSARSDFEAIVQTAVNLPATSAQEGAVQGQILTLLAQAHTQRETRTFQMVQGLPAPMWTVILSISLVLVGFVLFAGLERQGHLVLACAFTFCTAMVLVLIQMLDYPFEGALALGNEDFNKVFGEVTAMLRA